MLKHWVCFVGLFSVAACQDAMGPDRGDPAQYALSGFAFYCSHWSPEQPTVKVGLFDVLFPATHYQGLNSTKGGLPPSDEQRHVILALGGTIVHQFQVPIIRAIFPINNVPRLFGSRTTRPNYLRGISDPTDLNVSAAIGYTRAITVSDTAYLRALGVQINHVFSFPAIQATLPDSAVGLLRARPEVQYVEAGGIGCVTD